MWDLSNYSIAELSKTLKAIPGEILRRESEEKARTLKEIEALAAQNGYTLDELMRGARVKAVQPKKPVAIRYRSPEGQTWTGRGRTPTWDSLNNPLLWRRLS